jgi:hypothetical protein
MELAFAFPAMNADHSTEGQLWAAIVDFDRIAAPSFPVFTQFCIVAKFRVTPEEIGLPQLVRLDLTRPNGVRSQVSGDQQLNTVRHPTDPARSTGATIITSVGIVFAEPGDHFIHVIANGREVQSISLLVEEAPRDREQAVADD